MEIFTFLRMGGAMERIDLRLISNPDQDQAAAKKELAEQLATFDAAEAQCFNASSRRTGGPAEAARRHRGGLRRFQGLQPGRLQRF